MMMKWNGSSGAQLTCKRMARWSASSHATRKNKCYGSTVWELHCLRTALCVSIRYQAKSEQNVRQDLIPRERHMEAALMNPLLLTESSDAESIETMVPRQKWKWAFFWTAVFHCTDTMVSPSSVRPQSGFVKGFFCHVKFSSRNGACKVWIRRQNIAQILLLTRTILGTDSKFVQSSHETISSSNRPTWEISGN